MSSCDCWKGWRDSCLWTFNTEDACAVLDLAMGAIETADEKALGLLLSFARTLEKDGHVAAIELEMSRRKGQG